MKKIILDLCGGTGSWGKPWIDAGFDVKNITLPKYNVLYTKFSASGKWLIFRKDYNDNYRLKVKVSDIYGILAAPPCTQFSFARTKAKTPRDITGGMKLVNKCLEIIQYCQRNLKSDQQKYPPLKFWALENPYFGMLRWFLGKPAFIFDPYEFGDAYKKRTALWGHFKEPKKHPVDPTIQTDHNHAKLPKFDYMRSKDIHPEYYKKFDRQTRRAITPAGFAKAFYEANK